MSSAAWIQTVSGTKVDLLDPKPDQILIEDIAHALSHICRFTGHVEKFMSVAHHSVIVSNLVDPEFAFDGLMHDATEAYVNDLSRPLKNLLPEYKVVEERFALAIAEKFGVTHPLPKQVKDADNVSLLWERRDLMKAPPEAWVEEHLVTLVPEQPLYPWTPAEARAEFMHRFHELSTSC